MMGVSFTWFTIRFMDYLHDATMTRLRAHHPRRKPSSPPSPAISSTASVSHSFSSSHSSSSSSSWQLSLLHLFLLLLIGRDWVDNRLSPPAPRRLYSPPWPPPRDARSRGSTGHSRRNGFVASARRVWVHGCGCRTLGVGVEHWV